MQESIRSWLEGRFLSPVVVLVPSGCSEAAAQKNGMSMVQLLRPFFTYNKRGTHVRLSEKADAMSLNNFSVRIMYPECCENPDPHIRAMHSIEAFKDASHIELKFKGPQLDSVIASISQPPSFAVLEGQQEDDFPERKALKENPLYHVAPDVDYMMKNMSQESFERHFFALHEKFAKDYIYMVRCSYFDTIDHPIAHIMMCSTNPFPSQDEPPNVDVTSIGARVSRILKQFNIGSKRAEVLAARNVTMDQDIMKHFILVHDASDTNSSIEDSRKIKSLIANHVGPQNLVLIEINSCKETNGEGEVASKLWVDANIHTPDHYTTDGSGVVYTRVGSEFTTANTLENIVRTCATGWLMSRNDVEALDVQVGNILVNRLVPYMEKKYRQMTLSVKEKRQTGLSKVASWFRGSDNKPKQDAFVKGKDSTPTKYLSNSLELIMRRLADFSLFLRDFEGANQMYKYLRDDLIDTLSQRNFNGCLIAAALEGVSLAHYFLGKLQLPAVTRFGDCRLEAVRDEYIKYNVPTYGLRASLMMYLLCRHHTPVPANDKALSVLEKCITISGMDSTKFYTAVLHDMCGLCTLFNTQQLYLSKNVCTNRGLRKYARLMVISGSEYSDEKVQFPEMALKCFSRAQRVYRYKMINTRSWTGIYNELVIQQGKLYIHFGNLARSVGIYTAAIGGGSSLFNTNSKASENVRNYVSQLQAYLDECKRVPELQKVKIIPHMLLPNVKIPLYTSREAHYNPDDITKQEEEMLGGDIAQREWSAMETVLKTYYSSSTPYVMNKFEPHKATLQRLKSIRGQNRNAFCYAGNGGSTSSQKDNVTHEAGACETIYVTVQFSNPVAMELELEDVCLCYIDTTAYDAKKDDQEHPVTLYGPKVTGITLPRKPPNDAASHDGTRRVTLPFMSESTGFYKIVGVAWSVLGVRGQLLLSTKEARHGEEESKFEYATENPYPAWNCDEYLTIHVKPPEARLSLTLDPPLPENIRDGFTHRCEMILKNHSDKVPATSISLLRSQCTSHWIYFEDFDYDTNENHEKVIVLADEYKKQLKIETTENKITTPRVNSTLSEVNQGRKLLTDYVEAGSELRLSVCIRASASGGGFGTMGSLTTAEDTPGITSSNIGWPFHVAFMVGYFPGGFADFSPKTTLPNIASKNIHLCTFLRRVQMSSSLAVTTVVTPSTAVRYRGTVPRGIKEIPGASRFANISLVLVNRGAKFEYPIRICRITCLHDPSWVFGLPDVVTGRLQEPLNGKDCVTDALYANDSLACLTCSNQGITLQIAVGRRTVSDSDIIHRQIFVSENTRLCESVLLDEALMNGNSKNDTSPMSKRQDFIQKKIYSCKPLEEGSDPATVGCNRCVIPSPLWYQLTHSILISDREFGDVPPTDGENMAFYVDKGGAGTSGPSKTYTVEDISALEQGQMDGYIKAHVSRFGKVPGQFPPVCFIVTWCTEANSTSSFGTTFHFVDVRHQMTVFAKTPVGDCTNVLNDRVISVTGVLSPPVALGGSSSTTTTQQSNSILSRTVSHTKSNIVSNSVDTITQEHVLTEANRQTTIRAFIEGRSSINCAIYSAADTVVGLTQVNEESAKLLEVSNTLGKLRWNPLSIAYIKTSTSATTLGISHVPVPLLPVTYGLVSVLGKYKSCVHIRPNDSQPGYGSVKVPLRVLVTNHSPLPLKIDLSIHSHSTVRSQRIKLPSPALSHFGATKRIFIVLPDETHIVQFVLIVVGSGMYNLNTIRFNSIEVIKMVDGMRTGDHPSPYISAAADEALKRTVVVVSGMDLVWPLSVVKHSVDKLPLGKEDKVSHVNLNPAWTVPDLGLLETSSYLKGIRIDLGGVQGATDNITNGISSVPRPIKKNGVIIPGDSGFTSEDAKTHNTGSQFSENLNKNPFMNDEESSPDESACTVSSLGKGRYIADSDTSIGTRDVRKPQKQGLCKFENHLSVNQTKISLVEHSESDDSSYGLYKPRKQLLKGAKVKYTKKGVTKRPEESKDDLQSSFVGDYMEIGEQFTDYVPLTVSEGFTQPASVSSTDLDATGTLRESLDEAKSISIGTVASECVYTSKSTNKIEGNRFLDNDDDNNP